MTSPLPDPYKTLGIEKDADISVIKSAYRKLVLKCHPDKVQDPTLKAAKQDEFQRVQQAYEILVDETKRKEYDLNVKIRKMREEAVRNMTRPTATSRTSSKAYPDYHVRTAEPPPSFKPGPPPSPYAPYQSNGPAHSHSYDRDFPFRFKSGYDDGHRARRATSYEKPRDATKEERRRQKEEDIEPSTSAPVREWREREHEKEKERDKKARSDREKEDKRDKQRKDTEKRERERDRLRRQDQQEKTRSRKGAYVEPYDESEDDIRTPRKKPASGSGGKKHPEATRRDKSARRDNSPSTETATDLIQDRMKRAADYMVDARRRGSKSNTNASHFNEGSPYGPHFPDPDVAWHGNGDPPRPRRTSQDEKKFRSRTDADEDVDQFSKSDRRPPRLAKSYTSPAGAMHVANSSAPRIPSLNRASTMDYSRAPPQAPPAPSPDPSRSKSEHRRRGSLDAHEDDLRPRRSSTNPHVLHYPVDESAQTPRTSKPVYYKHESDYYQPPSRVKTASLYPEQVYQTKRYSDEDIVYSTVNHSAEHYSPPHTSYVGAYD